MSTGNTIVEAIEGVLRCICYPDIINREVGDDGHHYQQTGHRPGLSLPILLFVVN